MFEKFENITLTSETAPNLRVRKRFGIVHGEATLTGTPHEKPSFFDRLRRRKKSEENNNINSNSLLQIIKYNAIILKKLAIKKKDTIAIVLENGPEFITSFLSCINSTVAAPLNPNYTASEFDFYFKDLKPKALITNLPSNHPSIKTVSYTHLTLPTKRIV